MKRVLSFLLIAVMMFSVGSVTYSEDGTSVVMTLNGEKLSFSSGTPYIKDAYMMVPAREFSQKLGFSVSWNSPNVTLSSAEYTLVFTYNSTHVTINGEDIKAPVSTDIKDGVSYIPLAFLIEKIGAHLAQMSDAYAITTVQNTLNFTEKLNQQMPTDQNYMFSPLSIKLAMAMAASGAQGITKKEITDILGIPDLSAYDASVKEMMSGYENNQNFTLDIANSVWLNRDYYQNFQFSGQYQSVISQDFGGNIRAVDADHAVSQINNWVSQKTHQKIKEIISDNNFLAILLNATYFKAKWACPFEKSDTVKDTFTDRNGSRSQIDFMNNTDDFDYTDQDGVQMVRLPYKDCHISMYVAITDNRSVNLEDYIKDMKEATVAVHMPKFKTEYDTSLKDILQNLGIVTAFNPSDADFSPMFTAISTGDNVYISDVLHKSYIDVDEEGTEAAAATGVIMAPAAAGPTKPIEFNADHPFTYFIRDDDSGEILFMGEYAYAS